MMDSDDDNDLVQAAHNEDNDDDLMEVAVAHHMNIMTAVVFTFTQQQEQEEQHQEQVLSVLAMCHQFGFSSSPDLLSVKALHISMIFCL